MKSAASRRNDKRLQKLQKKLDAESNRGYGHDLAPDDWAARLLSFGSGKDGQLGSSMLLNSSKGACTSRPCWVTLEAAEGEYGLRTPTQIECGGSLSLAAMAAGHAYCWGDGFLGNSKQSEKSRIPRLVSNVKDVVFVACGTQGHCAVVSSTGELWTWGEGSHGRLGHGNGSSIGLPRKVHALAGKQVMAIACGGTHTLAVVLADGGEGKGVVPAGCTGNNATPAFSLHLHLSTPRICTSSHKHTLPNGRGRCVCLGWRKAGPMRVRVS